MNSSVALCSDNQEIWRRSILRYLFSDTLGLFAELRTPPDQASQRKARESHALMKSKATPPPGNTDYGARNARCRLCASGCWQCPVAWCSDKAGKKRELAIHWLVQSAVFQSRSIYASYFTEGHH